VWVVLRRGGSRDMRPACPTPPPLLGGAPMLLCTAVPANLALPSRLSVCLQRSLETMSWTRRQRHSGGCCLVLGTGSGAGLLLASHPSCLTSCMGDWMILVGGGLKVSSIPSYCCCREPVDFGAGAPGDAQRQRQIEQVSALPCYALGCSLRLPACSDVTSWQLASSPLCLPACLLGADAG
jgi:hypothetical protein